MWGRQWFDHYSQLGLEDESLEAEHFLQNHQYIEAHSCIIHLANKYSKVNDNPAIVHYCKRQVKRIAHIEKSFIKSPSLCNKTLRIAFVDFWEAFDPYESSLFALLNKSCAIPVDLTNDIGKADIIICSCFGNKIKTSKNIHATRILYLGENIRPQYSDYDYSLSFDHNTYCGRNVNLPLWILSTDLWTTNKHELTSVKALTRGKVVHPHNKEKAICIITNNFTPFRAELIHRFRSIGYMVDVYGQHFKPVLDKGLLMSQYTFSLCPENSIYPGYVTEKIIHAAFSNTVPIYTGGIEHEGLEMNAFLYLDSDLQNFNNIVTKMNTKLESTSIYLPPLASHSVITAKCSKIEQSIEKILSLYSYE